MEIAQQVWAKTGMAEAATRVGAPLVLFKEAEWKRLNGYDYFIARPLYEADLVINLPKMKTHLAGTVTLGVKNWQGIIPNIHPSGETVLYDTIAESIPLAQGGHHRKKALVAALGQIGTETASRAATGWSDRLRRRTSATPSRA